MDTTNILRGTHQPNAPVLISETTPTGNNDACTRTRGMSVWRLSFSASASAAAAAASVHLQ